jgi:HprK-related kinase A
VIISQLGYSSLAQRLSSPNGLIFKAGPYTIRLRSQERFFAKSLDFFYGEYPLMEEGSFADLHISMQRPWGVRRWWRPQILIDLDGRAVLEPFPLDHALPHYEWGVNFFIAKRFHQYLMLHAAVVEKYGKAVILPAYPGSGKSTLCAALVLKGWRLLSDEFGFVRPADARMIPMPRPIALKNQSIEIIRQFSQEAVLGPVFPNTRKGAVAHLRPPAASVARMGEAAAPHCVVFPLYQANAPATLAEVAKSYALLKLATNAFNYEVMGRVGFDLAAQIVNACACYNLSYGHLDDAIAQIEGLAQA